MRYFVDLDKKVITYDTELPIGHVAALKKIFEPQGYKFKDMSHITVVGGLFYGGEDPVKSSRVTMPASMRSSSYAMTYMNMSDPHHPMNTVQDYIEVRDEVEDIERTKNIKAKFEKLVEELGKKRNI